MLLVAPGGEQPVLGVEVPAAHVIEHLTGQSIPGGLAAAQQEFLDSGPGSRGTLPAQGLQLLTGDSRQRDLDGRLRLPGISSSRSSARTGVSLPTDMSSSD